MRKNKNICYDIKTKYFDKIKTIYGYAQYEP